MSMKLTAISRLASSFSEPVSLLTIFHSMFHGEDGVEHYSRRPHETTRTTQNVKMAGKISLFSVDYFFGIIRYNPSGRRDSSR